MSGEGTIPADSAWQPSAERTLADCAAKFPGPRTFFVMSAREQRVLDGLVKVWNDFLELPVEHPEDQAEFRALIHAAQEKIAARPTFRTINAARPC